MDFNSLLDEAKENREKSSIIPPNSTIAKDEAKIERYNPLAFENAVEFLYVFDRALREGKKDLHPWQRETLLFLSNKDSYQFRVDTPLTFYLCACNGSGKDAYVIAGIACYILCCWRRYKVVITSSSDQQLDTQTRSYITNLCNEVNQHLKEDWGIPNVIKVKTETFKAQTFQTADGKTFSLTGSEILTFVTKEGGKAEGHHPYPDADSGEGVVLIANEAKTIPQEIFDHFQKCTYNIFIKVSSSGEAKENFYNGFKSARDWKDGYIPGKPFRRLVTYTDCPHLAARVEVEKEEYGEDSDWFRKTRKSEFVSTEGNNVISDKKLTKCLQSPRGKIDIGIGRFAGLDLGAGGDPSSLWIFDNNICLYKERWNFKDTQLTIDKLCGEDGTSGLFKEFNLQSDKITGDDNGVGQAIIDALARRGWPIRRIRAQHSAINKVRYLNRGAELWFRVLRLIEEQILNFGDFIQKDDDVFRQLVSRHFTESNGKQKLLDKADEKAQGFPSPNDADAIVIAFSVVDIYEFIEQKNKAQIQESKPRAEVLGSEVIVDAKENNFKYNLALIEELKREHTNIKPTDNIQTLINSIYG